MRRFALRASSLFSPASMPRTKLAGASSAGGLCTKCDRLRCVKRMRRSYLTCGLFSVAASFTFMVLCTRITMAQDGQQLLDLTHSFDEATIYWPTEEGFKLLRGPAGMTDGGYFYVANRFMCAEHGGTH